MPTPTITLAASMPPGLYWIILSVSVVIHILAKIETDTKDNKVALVEYVRNWRNWLAVIIAYMQSSVLMWAGWIAYLQLKGKNPSITIHAFGYDFDLEMMIAITVVFIGYAGNSIWTNIMTAAQNRFKKKVEGENE